MKDGLENIDEIFKQAFDGFESNVDPGVWNNIQNSIASGSGSGSTPQVDPSAVSGVAGKSLALKIVAGAALVGTVATASYFVPDLFKDEESAITEAVVADNVAEEIEETTLEVTEEKEELSNENTAVLTEVVEENANNKETVNESAPSEDNNSNNTVVSEETIKATNVVSNSDQKQTNTVKEPTVKKSPVKTNSTKKKKDDISTKITVKINVDVNRGTAPLTVQFDAISDGDVTYFWDFRDGVDNVSESSPVHTFTKEGTYRVELKGLNKYGETKSAYTDIIVEKDYSSSLQELPNIFSPNGDGLNDIIKVKGKNIEKIQVQICDSKGNPVYFMNSMDDAWDGKDQNGNYLIQGQYYMTVVAMGKDGKKHMKKSVINLRK